jgi:PTS system nitrogen regulatory IIA component
VNAISLGDLIAPEGVVFDLAIPTKRLVLQALAGRAAALAGLDPAEVAAVILEREALGSTGFGAGTAIPHGRVAGLARIVAVAARLVAPVDFAALDGLPVDLIVLMLAPSAAGADHLKALARVSRALRDVALCGKLRAATSADAFYSLLAGDVRSVAA